MSWKVRKRLFFFSRLTFWLGKKQTFISNFHRDCLLGRQAKSCWFMKKSEKKIISPWKMRKKKFRWLGKPSCPVKSTVDVYLLYSRHPGDVICSVGGEISEQHGGALKRFVFSLWNPLENHQKKGSSWNQKWPAIHWNKWLVNWMYSTQIFMLGRCFFSKWTSKDVHPKGTVVGLYGWWFYPPPYRTLSEIWV